MSYPYHPQGQYPPQYAYPPPATANAAVAWCSAALFGICSLLCFAFAVPGFDGVKPATMTRLTALIGQAFAEHTTRNIDFGVSATMTVGCATAVLALLLGLRFGVARWILVVLGTIVALYYVYALARLAGADAPPRFYLWIVLALIMWVAASIVAVLPITGRAMRGYRPPTPY